MSAKIIEGKRIAAIIQNNLKIKISERINQQFSIPGLAVVLVGNNLASQVYVKKKRIACHEVGIHSFAYDLPENTSHSELLNLVEQLNKDSSVHGILVQLPLPTHINSSAILDSIHPAKDVDGFHPHNLGLLAQGRPILRPCTPFGIMQLLQHEKISLAGLHAVVVGASNIVGRPMALELLREHCTVTVCHSATINLEEHIQKADLLVSAIGKTGIIRSQWIRRGTIVIDVGMNRSIDGRLVGDIDFESAKKCAGWITPVPGGVGPMTVTALLQNTIYAAEQSERK